jgi:hypothetical protein
LAIRYNFLALLSQIEAHLYRSKAQIEDESYQSAVESLNQASEACQLLNMADGKPIQDIIDLLLPELRSDLKDGVPAQIQLDGALAHAKELRDSLEIG